MYAMYLEMRAVVRFRKRQSLRQTRQTARRSERDRLIEWQRVRMSSELIWNSTVLVIIRESRQPLLNYRSHQHDWLRLGNCNTNLIIYRLYYYSDHFLGKVGVLPVPPHVRRAACHTGCSKFLQRQIFHILSLLLSCWLVLFFLQSFRMIWF